MSALSLAAVSGLEWEGSVAFSADFLVTVEFFSNSGNSGIHHTSSESQNKMEGRFFLDVVVGKTAAICVEI